MTTIEALYVGWPLKPLAEVDQSILADTENNAKGIYGNCLQAAVAAALALPLDAVPHLGSFAWWDAALRLWLRGHGLDVVRAAHVPPIPQDRCIVTGRSPRGNMHAVVGEGGEIVWDPHPTRGGLTEVAAAYVIVEWPKPGGDNRCFICGAGGDVDG